MKTQKGLRLYNMIFPIWMFWLLPMFTWWLVLPLNFAVDFAVLYLAMRYMRLETPFADAKRVILRVWLLGFAADIAGAALMMAGVLLGDLSFWNSFPALYDMLKELSYGLTANPFSHPLALFWTTVCVLISGVFIYLFNRRFGLKKIGLAEKERNKLAFYLAVFTAPYLFFLPATLLYAGY